MTPSPMIKVMSFNIRYGLAADGENHWDKRKSLAIARIHAFAPDLLGLQECRDDTQAEFIKTNLPAYHFYGVRREGGGETALEMAPLLLRQSVFQIIQKGHFWLSETPQIAGSKSWGSNFPRTVTWASLVHRPTGRLVTFVNTHFDYEPTAIDGNAHCLQDWLNQVGSESALIVTGDFNTDKNSTAYHLLTSHGALSDAFRHIQPEAVNATTFHDFGRSEENMPIDWVLVSDHFKVADARVDRWHEGNLFPSDHYPVTAVLEWKE